MKIRHRIGFNSASSPGFLQALKELGVHYKTLPLPGPPIGLGYGVYFDIVESDSHWEQVEKLIRTYGASNVMHTFFTRQEILQAEWVLLFPRFRANYPVYQADWLANPDAYEFRCPKCGIGYKQVSPLRLTRKPRMGQDDLLSMFWTLPLFCTSSVLDAFKIHEIHGYEVWPVVLNKTNQPLEGISQLVFPNIAKPGLAEADKIKPVLCYDCNLVKYAPHVRGYMHFERQALASETDIQQTAEWFGSGAIGYRYVLISNRLARLIIENGWRGVELEPILLV